MIKLFSFGPAFGLPDPSPFVTKINLYLKLSEIDFETVADVDNLRKAPKSKFPFINDDGEVIADSVFIIDHLRQKYNADLDAWLSDEQKAQSQLISKSLDENLYWCIVYSRWIKDDVWPQIRAQFFDGLPFPMNKIVAKLARSSTRKQIMGHGIGKHTDAEMLDIAGKSLKSLSTLLGDKPFFFGDKPSTLDVTAFAMIGALTLSTLETEMNQKAREFENLASFAQRIAKTYYPELSAQ